MAENISVKVYGYRIGDQGGHPILAEMNLPIKGAILRISKELVREYVDDVADIYGLHIAISCSRNTAIWVHDLDFFAMKAYDNEDQYIHRLTICNIKYRYNLMNLSIGTLQQFCNSGILSDCSIGRFESGYNIDPAGDNNGVCELTRCHIDHARVFEGIQSIIFKCATINYIHVKGCRLVAIENGSSVSFAVLEEELNELRLLKSIVNTLVGSLSLGIIKFVIQQSQVLQAFKLNPDRIQPHDVEVLTVLMRSSKQDYDRSKYCTLAIEREHALRGRLTRWHEKAVSTYHGFVSGFGYRPLYVLRFSSLVWLLFAGIFFLIPGGTEREHCQITGRLDSILSSAYLSLISFTTLGFGDVVAAQWSLKFLSGIEALLGVYSTTMFVMAMTKRYLDRP